MTETVSFEQVNSAARAALPELLRAWFPAGKVVGKEFVVGDLQGSPGDSLSINLRTGQWADFASTERGGDPISLAAAAFHGGDQFAAARALGQDLGLYVNGSGPVRAPAEPKPAEKAKVEWQSIVPPPADAPAPNLAGYDVIHEYRGTDGQTLFYIRRREGREGRRKQFNPLTFGTLDGKRGWHSKHPIAPRPLYNLHMLAAMPGAAVILCEGEKAADAAQIFFPDHACMSWPGGSGGVANADWSALTGRNVILWPDNDAPGAEAARDISDRLAGIAASVLVLPVDDLDHKADAADISPDDPSAWLEERLARVKPHGIPAADELDDPGYWDSLETISKGEANGTRPTRTRRPVDLPPIRVVDGDIDILADQGEEALCASGLPIFQRGRSLVRPIKQEVPTARGGSTLAAGLGELGTSSLIDLLNQAVEWQKYRSNEKKWRATNPPKQIAEIILSRAGQWSMPSIAGVITTPTLRPDGSLLHAPGYDATTRLFHIADRSVELSPAVHSPTKHDAARAIDLLQSLLSGFPFVGEVDRSVALSALITGITRGALPVAPMHAFRAYAAGSGKSYLADLMSYIATGRACPVMAISSKEEETEKRLVGLLMAGFPVVSIDNVNGELGGDLLCQAVERPLIRIRPLGRSDILEIESRATIVATGNGFRVRGDMTRRTLICTLDAKMERPELRTFDFDPVERVMADRGAYVSACLTIVRAYLLSGEQVHVSPIASFNDWSERVRAALIWLGCADPAESMETARENDPELTELTELAGLWKARIGDDAITCRELDERIQGRMTDDYGNAADFIMPDLRDAVLRIAGERGITNTKRLGKWLTSRAGRIVNGMRFEQVGKDRNGIAKWSIRSV